MRALVTGATGQDGHYLIQHLRNLGYSVVGARRRSTGGQLPDCDSVPFELTEYESVKRAIQRVKPTEIYNLGAQSHVGESFGCPLYTADVNYSGVLRILECIRETPIRLYQASTSEMFGGGGRLTEESPFAPRSPYAVSKLAAHQACGVYRKAYGVGVSCGILFNHESPLRGKDFVTRKVCYHAARNLTLKLGNVSSVRDWGHAGDYVRAMHLMLQNEPDDFVIATGESHTVMDLVEEAYSHVPWGPTVVEEDCEKRPWDVEFLEGDSTKAKEVLGWEPLYDFKLLIKEMMESELREVNGNQSNIRRVNFG